MGNPSEFARRMALEEVLGVFSDNFFDDVLPNRVLSTRKAADGTRDFLVQWIDRVVDNVTWVQQKYVAEDVITDFDYGLEYAEAKRIVDERQIKGAKEYQVEWIDNSEPSWEPDANIS